MQLLWKGPHKKSLVLDHDHNTKLLEDGCVMIVMLELVGWG